MNNIQFNEKQLIGSEIYYKMIDTVCTNKKFTQSRDILYTIVSDMRDDICDDLFPFSIVEEII